MTPNILDLVKQGNQQAITTLLNSNLQSKGITVRTSLKDDCLRIVLESKQVPDEQIMAALIQKDLAILSSSSIARVKIFGQQIGDDIPVWSRDLELIGKPEIDIPVRHAQPVEDAVNCPKCSSTQIMANKKGFGVGQAAVGAVLLGPIGLVGGMIGSNQLILSCMKCGHQWEPAQQQQKHENQLNYRVTSAKIKTMDIGERIVTSVCAFFICGILGIKLLAISVIGWIAGGLLLCTAIMIPYSCITGNKDFISKLVGNCPHCGKEQESSISAKEFNCKHCKRKVLIKERKFHTVLLSKK